MHRDPFFEIAAILGMGTLLGIAGQRLRQPLLIMFLLTGILAGPACFGLIESYAQIELLAHIGIAILLFIVGLKLDLGLIRTTGPVALATGLGQIIFTSVIGFGIALGLGMSMISAAYTAVALTFSSTIIVVKLLSDKKEIDSLHGQIAVGFLIVQDIAAIVALVGLTTLGSAMAEDSPGFVQPLVIVVKGVGFVGAVALLIADGQQLVVGLGGFDHFQGLVIVDCHRLFAHDVFARIQRIDRNFAVGAVRGADVDDLDGRVRKQLFIIGIDLCVFGAVFGGSFFGALFDEVAERHQLAHARAFQRRHMFAVGDPAASDNRNFCQ